MKLSEAESTMQKTVEATQRAFNTIRTGRANASLLDKVSVDYYGSPTPLKVTGKHYHARCQKHLGSAFR